MGAPELLAYLRTAGVGLALTTDGGIKVTPASALGDTARQAIRTHRAALLALLSGGADDRPDPPELTARLDRLEMWGWARPQARALAERLTRNAMDGDDRATCAADCNFYRPGQCGNHRRAGLASRAVADDLASVPQRCPGFQSVR